MSLSICLITRNQAALLERLFRSIGGLEAEVIVADTGSTDDTVSVALALGAKASVIEWHDDFGDAQNQALDQASGDWILWLNPDEELLLDEADLERLLAHEKALAYGVRVQEVSKAGQSAGFVETVHLRLFRRHPDARFLGRVHPHFAVPLEILARRDNQQIFNSELVVRHHAYLSVLTPDKLRWATRLLELELKDRPGQLHYLIEYGRHLLWLNDPKGHAVLAEASEQVLAAWDAPVAPTPTVASLLEYLLTVSGEQSQSRLTPAQARRLALRWFETSAPLVWTLAQRAFQAEDFQDAAQLLERLVHLGRTGAYDRSAAFDASIMAEPALLNLGTCYVHLGQLDRAEGCYEQVLKSATHQAQARKGIELVRGLRQAPGRS